MWWNGHTDGISVGVGPIVRKSIKRRCLLLLHLMIDMCLHLLWLDSFSPPFFWWLIFVVFFFLSNNPLLPFFVIDKSRFFRSVILICILIFQSSVIVPQSSSFPIIIKYCSSSLCCLILNLCDTNVLFHLLESVHVFFFMCHRTVQQWVNLCLNQLYYLLSEGLWMNFLHT